jgi:hypothetical protein
LEEGEQRLVSVGAIIWGLLLEGLTVTKEEWPRKGRREWGLREAEEKGRW